MQYLAFTLSANFQFIRIVVDDVLNLCLHISDNLMVHTLCCCFHSSAYKTSISVDKVYYLLVVFRVLVAHSTTLHHFQSLQRYFDSLYPPALNGCRKDKGVFFEVVSI